MSDNTILAVRFGRMGDFLVTLPALALLRRSAPRQRIVLVTGISSVRGVRARAAGYTPSVVPSWVESIRGVLVDDVLSVADPLGYSEWRRLRRSVGRFDICQSFLLQYYGDTHASRLKKLLWLRTLGIAGPVHRRSLKQDDLTRPDFVSKQVWAPYSIVRDGIGSSASGFTPYVLSVNQSDVLWARNRCGAAQTGAVVITVCIGATHSHKRWAGSAFAAVCRQLIHSFGATIVVVGLEQERREVDALFESLPPGMWLNLCGGTTFGQLAAVLKQSDMFVGNDGGTAHLAAAVGTKCVTIVSGVREPGVWDPTCEGSISVRANVPCAGCGAEEFCPKGHNDCIKNIQVNTVVDAVACILHQRRCVK